MSDSIKILRIIRTDRPDVPEELALKPKSLLDHLWDLFKQLALFAIFYALGVFTAGLWHY